MLVHLQNYLRYYQISNWSFLRQESNGFCLNMLDQYMELGCLFVIYTSLHLIVVPRKWMKYFIFHAIYLKTFNSLSSIPFHKLISVTKWHSKPWCCFVKMGVIWILINTDAKEKRVWGKNWKNEKYIEISNCCYCSNEVTLWSKQNFRVVC